MFMPETGEKKKSTLASNVSEASPRKDLRGTLTSWSEFKKQTCREDSSTLSTPEASDRICGIQPLKDAAKVQPAHFYTLCRDPNHGAFVVGYFKRKMDSCATICGDAGGLWKKCLNFSLSSFHHCLETAGPWGQCLGILSLVCITPGTAKTVCVLTKYVNELVTPSFKHILNIYWAQGSGDTRVSAKKSWFLLVWIFHQSGKGQTSVTELQAPMSNDNL